MKPTGATKEAGIAITAYWAKSDWEGRCQHCRQKPDQVAIIVTAFKLRLCGACLESLRDISDSLLSDAPATPSTSAGGG